VLAGLHEELRYGRLGFGYGFGEIRFSKWNKEIFKVSNASNRVLNFARDFVFADFVGVSEGVENSLSGESQFSQQTFSFDFL
jgi:hypothetical protein